MVLSCDARNVNEGEESHDEIGSELKNELKLDSKVCCNTQSDAEFKMLVKAKDVLLKHKSEYDLYLSMDTKLSFDTFLSRYKNVARASMHFADVEQPSLK